MNENIWSELEKSEIKKEIEDYFHLYLFKGNFLNIQNGICELFNLKKKEFESLKAAHFLLSRELKEFIEVLPQLLRNLTHSTLKEKIESRGIIKGRVDWNYTYKSRYTLGYNDPSLFVCTPPLKSYDLCENQVLKFLIEKIIYLYENPLQFIKNIDGIKTDWHSIISSRYFKAEKAMNNIYFNNISSVKAISPKHLRKTQNNRNQYYKKVANLYKLYEELFIKNTLEKLKELLSKQLIKPASDDTLYELFVFFKLISALDYDKINLGLLMPGNDYSVKYEDDDIKLKIYYQNTPTIFYENSKYKNIFENYQINASLKRPDIILEFEKDNKKIYRIIEVKRTKEDSYLRESVYKVLGYLGDFDGVPFTEDIPGVIISWKRKGYLSKKAFNEDVLVLNKKEFLEKINMILNICC
ncbi:MAG: hypothetical protein KO202_07545 [Methanobacteriaceae archaeon]|jgi:hypothetical protein|nr:hypothetical protein [Methanobacteriaceae archaeon]